MGERASTWLMRVTGLTNRGKVRPNLEDAIAAGRWVRGEPMGKPEVLEIEFGRPTLCVVADGMGGHAAGEVASFHAATRLAQSADAMADEASAAATLQRLSDELVELARGDAAAGGMGTTVAGLVAGPTGLLLFNVGDSRIYREQNGYLRQLSIDDTSGPGPEAGDSPAGPRASHVLTQALGGSSRPLRIAPHIRREDLTADGRYLLCSDGLTDMVGPDALEACLDEDDEATVMNMLSKAQEGGGVDNISIVVVRILETAARPSAGPSGPDRGSAGPASN